MRIDLTQQEIAIILHALRIAIEDGSIYKGENDSTTNQIVDDLKKKLKRAPKS